jgi:hypothetical protein
MHNREKFIHDRLKELAEEATRQGIDWKSATADVRHDDPGLMLVIVASLLRIRLVDAFDEHVGLKDAQARTAQQSAEDAGRLGPQ